VLSTSIYAARRMRHGILDSASDGLARRRRFLQESNTVACRHRQARAARRRIEVLTAAAMPSLRQAESIPFTPP